MLCWHSTAFWGWLKPENLENHDFYETHQKFSFSFPVHDSLHIRTPFISGCEIHRYKICPIVFALHETLLFIDIRLQYYMSHCASSNCHLERVHKDCISHCVRSPVSLSCLVSIFNCSQRCVGRPKQLRVGRQKWQWQNLWDQYWATKRPLGFFALFTAISWSWCDPDHLLHTPTPRETKSSCSSFLLIKCILTWALCFVHDDIKLWRKQKSKYGHKARFVSLWKCNKHTLEDGALANILLPLKPERSGPCFQGPAMFIPTTTSSTSACWCPHNPNLSCSSISLFWGRKGSWSLLDCIIEST